MKASQILHLRINIPRSKSEGIQHAMSYHGPAVFTHSSFRNDLVGIGVLGKVSIRRKSLWLYLFCNIITSIPASQCRLLLSSSLSQMSTIFNYRIYRFQSLSALQVLDKKAFQVYFEVLSIRSITSKKSYSKR